MWPVLLPAVTEIVQAFSTSISSSPKSSTPFTNDVTDFLDILNSLDFTSQNLEDTAPQAGQKPSTQEKTELRKPDSTTVQEGESSTTPRKQRIGTWILNDTKPDQVPSAEPTVVPPIPTLIIRAVKWEAVPATFSVEAAADTSLKVDNSEDKDRQPIEDTKPPINEVRSTPVLSDPTSYGSESRPDPITLPPAPTPDRSEPPLAAARVKQTSNSVTFEQKPPIDAVHSTFRSYLTSQLSESLPKPTALPQRSRTDGSEPREIAPDQPAASVSETSLPIATAERTSSSIIDPKLPPAAVSTAFTPNRTSPPSATLPNPTALPQGFTRDRSEPPQVVPDRPATLLSKTLLPITRVQQISNSVATDVKLPIDALRTASVSPDATPQVTETRPDLTVLTQPPTTDHSQPATLVAETLQPKARVERTSNTSAINPKLLMNAVRVTSVSTNPTSQVTETRPNPNALPQGSTTDHSEPLEIAPDQPAPRVNSVRSTSISNPTSELSGPLPKPTVLPQASTTDHNEPATLVSETLQPRARVERTFNTAAIDAKPPINSVRFNSIPNPTSPLSGTLPKPTVLAQGSTTDPKEPATLVSEPLSPSVRVKQPSNRVAVPSSEPVSSQASVIASPTESAAIEVGLISDPQPLADTRKSQSTETHSLLPNSSPIEPRETPALGPAPQPAISAPTQQTIPLPPGSPTKPQSRAIPSAPQDNEDEVSRLAPESTRSPSAEAMIPKSPLPVSAPSSLFTPAPDPTSQPDSPPPAREDRAPSLPAGQLVAKLSQSTFSQPAFTAFEARLSPRILESKPLSEVTAPLPTITPTTTVSAKAEHAEPSFEAQLSNAENDGPKPKSGAPAQLTTFETKPEKISEAVPTTTTTRPITARRFEPTERQSTTTPIQVPQGQTVARPQTLQHSKLDTHASTSSSAPDLAEPPAPQAGPVRDISFRIGSSAADSVNVKILDRAGQIHVAVQSGDSAVAQTLQSNVKELASKLETSGFHTETFIPGRIQAAPESQQNQAFQDFQQNRRAPEQEQRAQKKRRSDEDATFTLIPNQENQ